HAAENGVVAADLASIGWTASEEILEAKEGWFSAAGGGFDPNAIMNRLGKPWTFANPGVSIKPFPSGSLTHPAMGEMLRLAKEHNINPANVEKVDMGGNSGMMSALIQHKPVNSLQGKFSMEFCMAILLLDRKAGLNEFTDAVVNYLTFLGVIRSRTCQPVTSYSDMHVSRRRFICAVNPVAFAMLRHVTRFSSVEPE